MILSRIILTAFSLIYLVRCDETVTEIHDDLELTTDSIEVTTTEIPELPVRSSTAAPLSITESIIATTAKAVLSDQQLSKLRNADGDSRRQNSKFPEADTEPFSAEFVNEDNFILRGRSAFGGQGQFEGNVGGEGEFVGDSTVGGTGQFNGESIVGGQGQFEGGVGGEGHSSDSQIVGGQGQFNGGTSVGGQGQFDGGFSVGGEGQFNGNPIGGQGQFNGGSAVGGQGQFNGGSGVGGQGQFDGGFSVGGEGQFNGKPVGGQGQFNGGSGVGGQGQFNGGVSRGVQRQFGGRRIIGAMTLPSVVDSQPKFSKPVPIADINPIVETSDEWLESSDILSVPASPRRPLDTVGGYFVVREPQFFPGNDFITISNPFLVATEPELPSYSSPVYSSQERPSRETDFYFYDESHTHLPVKRFLFW